MVVMIYVDNNLTIIMTKHAVDTQDKAKQLLLLKTAEAKC